MDAADWGQRTASNENDFNSVPKLTVSTLEMTSFEGGVKFNLAVENFGDVEVAPEGTIDVRSAGGQRLIALNISKGSIVAESHTTVPPKKSTTVPYLTGSTTSAPFFITKQRISRRRPVRSAVESDIVPVVVPEAARFREAAEAQLAPVTEGASILLIGAWVLLGGGLGIVAALAGLVVGSRVLGLPKQ